MIDLNNKEQLFKDFIEFSKHHVYSRDIDPVYPVLKYVQKARNLSKIQSIWSTLLYITWYNLGSAEKVFQKYPYPQKINEKIVLPTGTERRQFRGEVGGAKAIQQLNTINDSLLNLEEWCDDMTSCEGELGWTRTRQAIEKIKYNATWASYKWADLMKSVHGYNITAPDIGVGGQSPNASPVAGLMLITGITDYKRILNERLQKAFYHKCLNAGAPWKGLEEMETSLCDFNSVCHGKYYCGHDIDLQMTNIEGLPEVYWEARKASFPHEYLGECNGWNGVRSELKKKYIDKGEIYIELPF